MLCSPYLAKNCRGSSYFYVSRLPEYDGHTIIKTKQLKLTTRQGTSGSGFQHQRGNGFDVIIDGWLGNKKQQGAWLFRMVRREYQAGKNGAGQQQLNAGAPPRNRSVQARLPFPGRRQNHSTGPWPGRTAVQLAASSRRCRRSLR